MYTTSITEDLKVFGRRVTSFPLGIAEAFDELLAMLPAETPRLYYGLSECTAEGIVYIAAVEEKHPGEAEAYGCQRYTVEKGDYLAITVKDWQQKTDSIKQVFGGLYDATLADRSKPSVEVYHDDTTMVCMVRIDPFKQLSTEFKTSTEELLALIGSLDDEALNKPGADGSWKVAQVAAHLHLSDKGMLRIFNGRTGVPGKKPDEHVHLLKDDLLNFNIKNESPRFVRPAEIVYQGKELLTGLNASRQAIAEKVNQLDLSLIYHDFPFPVPGGMTGLEVFAFIVYHTQRHIHQIKKILQHNTVAASTA